MKKIFSILIIVIMIVCNTGCSKKEDNTLGEIVYKDENSGYTTVFNFNNKSDFKIKSVDNNSGKYSEMIIENQKLNIIFDIYYIDTNDDSFANLKESRKDSDNYKEYLWNNYEGYSYNGDKYSIDINIKFNDEVGLFGNVGYIDYKSANILNAFNSQEFQDFMYTIKFSK